MANREQAFSHDDTNDRIIAKSFLETQGWYNINFGGKYDLDLEVKTFERGCDVEMINYGMDRFERFNHFRIPVRKYKYWSELPTYVKENGIEEYNKYQNWYVDYIQFLNSSLTELVWYNWKTIKHYKDKIYFDKHLLPKGFTERGSTFITIPYNYIKEFSGIKHYKLESGSWTKQNN